MFRNPLGDVRMMGNIAAQQEAANIYETPPYTSGSYNASVSGFASFTTNLTYYITIGKLCTVFVAIEGVSNSVNFNMNAPFTAKTLAGMYWETLVADLTDNSVNLSSPGRAYIASAGTAFNLNKTMTSGAGTWTAANNKGMIFTLTYWMA